MLDPGQKERLETLLGADRSPGAELLRQAAGALPAPLREVEAFALERGAVPKRYARNIGTLGLDGQKRLLESGVLVVGLGGLGGHVAELLARLGVGRITGVDADSFDETNLNRQVLSDLDNLGRGKAAVAAARVARINPAVEFTARAARFEALGPELFAGTRLAFDCLDTIPSKRELAARCARAGLPLVHGAIAGWSGQVAVVMPGDDLLERVYGRAAGSRGAELELGNLPMTAAMAADLMVAAAVPLLLGRPAPKGLRLFDLLDPGL